MKTTFMSAVAATLLIFPSFASAAEPSPAPASYPKVGGHVGLAIPIVTIADPVTAIGADFTKIGLAPGVTVHLNDRWAVDFEFVAYSNFWGTANISSLVVDPGLLYKADFATLGLRAAVHVAQTQNFGVIPIIVKGFPLGDGTVKAFVELDLPVFFNEAGASLTVQPQAGIAF